MIYDEYTWVRAKHCLTYTGWKIFPKTSDVCAVNTASRPPAAQVGLPKSVLNLGQPASQSLGLICGGSILFQSQTFSFSFFLHETIATGWSRAHGHDTRQISPRLVSKLLSLAPTCIFFLSAPLYFGIRLSDPFSRESFLLSHTVPVCRSCFP